MNDQARTEISRRAFFQSAAGAAAASVLTPGLVRRARAQQSLSLLAWVGYEEQELIRPFEQQQGVRLNVKTYVGGDQMMSLFVPSKGVYDVLLLDPEYLQKLHAMGRLAELDPKDYDFGNYLPLFRRYPPTFIGDKMWGVDVRYGFNGLVFNRKKILQGITNSYKVLWDPSLKGRVGIWDWYLPSMGVLSRYLGHKDPYALTDEQFTKLADTLFSLRPNVGAVFPDPSAMLASLANEQIWIVPAGGDWVAAALQEQGHAIDWAVPQEGGVIWSECLAIPTDSRNRELAKTYIRYMMTPRAQALLAWRKAYTSQIPNIDAWQHMTDKQKAVLQITTREAAQALLARASIRELPSNQPEAKWQEVWQRFKAGL